MRIASKATRLLAVLVMLSACGIDGAGQSAVPDSATASEARRVATPARLERPIEVDYPAAAGGVGGIAVVECRVGSGWGMRPLRVISSPHKALTDAVVNELILTQAIPARDEDGRSIESTLTVEVAFPSLDPEFVRRPSDDEYAVYTALLGRNPERSHLVTVSGTTRDLASRDVFNAASLTRHFEKSPASKGLLDATLVESFRVARRLATPIDISRLPGAQARPAGSTGDTHLALSRVGFNHDRTVALVATYFYCGPLCAEGEYVLVVKKRGLWRVQERMRTWIS